MINGMSPQQYATVVADLCGKVLSERSLDYHESRGLPVTQNVICTLNQPYRTSLIDENCIEVSERTLTFKFCIEGWKNGSVLSFESLWYEFHADFTKGSSVRDTVYNAVFKSASELDTDPNSEVKVDPSVHTVLMFITRIRCGEHENPETIRRAYINRMKSKYSLDIPDELVQVSSDMLDYDFDTTVKFVPGNARRALPKFRLKQT